VGEPEPPAADRAQLDYLQRAVDHQKQAYAHMGRLRGRQPQLRMHVVAQLAQGEAALGGALHALVTEGRGDEAQLKRAAEALSAAQTHFDQLGERAHVQLMMRRQGSLHLAAALQEQLDTGRAERAGGRERAAATRLTLALRHYERALAPQLLATASDAMHACAAEARLELANFFLSWADGAVSGGGGSKLRHLDAALQHARDARQAAPTTADGGVSLPEDVLASLADAEKRALRELLRAHAAAGNAARAAQLREEYRALLQQAV